MQGKNMKKRKKGKKWKEQKKKDGFQLSLVQMQIKNMAKFYSKINNNLD